MTEVLERPVSLYSEKDDTVAELSFESLLYMEDVVRQYELAFFNYPESEFDK